MLDKILDNFTKKEILVIVSVIGNISGFFIGLGFLKVKNLINILMEK